MTRKKVIHINQHRLKRNVLGGEREPVVTYKNKSGGPAAVAHQVSVRDAAGREVARVVVSLDKPLSCGARAWVETTLDLVPLDRDGRETESTPAPAPFRLSAAEAGLCGLGTVTRVRRSR